MTVLHHSNNEELCPLCEEKLKGAHPYLAEWFRRIRRKDRTAHVAYAHRNREEQHKCVLAGATRLEYPFSPHNHEVDGNPCSLALDLFRQDDRGIGSYPTSMYAAIDKENVSAGEPMIWGGKFKDRFDGPHFQLSQRIKI